eukprot:tig00021350_g20648.t1
MASAYTCSAAASSWSAAGGLGCSLSAARLNPAYVCSEAVQRAKREHPRPSEQAALWRASAFARRAVAASRFSTPAAASPRPLRIECRAPKRKGRDARIANLPFLTSADDRDTVTFKDLVAQAQERAKGEGKGPRLAARARCITPPAKVMERVLPVMARVYRDPYNAERNPGGVIDLGVAQSRIAWDLLRDRLRAPRDVTERHAHYSAYRGLPSFREALCPFLETFLGAPVDPGELVLAPGATGALDALAAVLFDAGDAVLVPAPYYYSFDVDFAYRGQVSLVPVETEAEDGFAWEAADFESALADAEAAGLRVRGVLVSNPDNPLGRPLTRRQLMGLIDLCGRKGLHLISDEVYANSVHGAGGGTFVSAWECAADAAAAEEEPGALLALVHVVWAFSKDFGLSGYRVGLAASRNAAALDAMAALARFSCVSSDTQAALEPIVGDLDGALRFLASHQARLLAAHDRTVAVLADLDVPRVPASAGLFVWAKLAPEAESEEDEARVFEALGSEGVYVMPGAQFHCPEPGWFRIVFAQEEGVLEEGLRRLAAAVRRCRAP